MVELGECITNTNNNDDGRHMYSFWKEISVIVSHGSAILTPSGKSQLSLCLLNCFQTIVSVIKDNTF